MKTIQIIVKSLDEINAKELDEFDAVSFISDDETFREILKRDRKLRELYSQILNKRIQIILIKSKNIQCAKKLLLRFGKVSGIRRVLLIKYFNLKK